VDEKERATSENSHENKTARSSNTAGKKGGWRAPKIREKGKEGTGNCKRGFLDKVVKRAENEPKRLSVRGRVKRPTYPKNRRLKKEGLNYREAGQSRESFHDKEKKNATIERPSSSEKC